MGRTVRPLQAGIVLLLILFCIAALCTGPAGEEPCEEAPYGSGDEKNGYSGNPDHAVTFDPAGKKPVRLIFIHHSCGENWLTDDNGDLGRALMQNNYFVSDTNYGWGPGYGPEKYPIGDMTDIGQWWAWFRSPEAPAIMNRVYAEDGQHSVYTRFAESPGGENEVIMFKSCFPNSALQGNAGDPVPSIENNLLREDGAWSEYHTVANAKGIYLDLLEYFKTRPDKLFIVVTAPPLSEGTHAGNARAFNTWLVNDYLSGYSGRNVVVYDFYNVLTSNGGSSSTSDAGRTTGNHHRMENGAVRHIVESGMMGSHNTAAYASGWDDDHPTVAGNRKATEEFVPFLNHVYAEWKAGA